jgi:hypothetical protein
MFLVFIFIASILSSNAKENFTCGILMDDGSGADVGVISFSEKTVKGCPKQITIENVAKGIKNKEYKLSKSKELEIYLDQDTSAGPCFYKLNNKTVTCEKGIFQ